MATSEAFLKERVGAIFGTQFNERVGKVVPTTADVALKDGAVKIEAAFLYADLAGSAKMSKVCLGLRRRKSFGRFLIVRRA